MPDAALFDWDGTLLDSREALLSAWHEASVLVIGRRFPVSADEEGLVFTLPGSQLFPHVGGDATTAAALKTAFQKSYARTGKKVRAFGGIPAALRELRAGGLLIGVVTSKTRRRLELDVVRAGFDGLLDATVCQEDSERHKPDPSPVRAALDALGVAASRAAMVGDTPVDIAAGAAAGTRKIGVAWGAFGAQPLVDAGADVVAHQPADLIGLLLSQRALERTSS